MLDTYQRLAKYYDLIYDYKDYEKETDFIEKIFKKFSLFKPRRILDLGCGTGGHIIPLTKRGYVCVGVDLSKAMIRLAKEKAVAQRLKNLEFKVASMHDFKVPGSFDGVISMSSAICFLHTYKYFRAALEKIRFCLKEGGLLIFDFWNGLVVINQYSPTKVALRRRKNIELVRISETKLDFLKQQAKVKIKVNIIKDKRLIDDFEDEHVVRFYFLDEMRNYLENNGFQVLHFCPFGKLDKKVDILKDWNVTVVCRKVG